MASGGKKGKKTKGKTLAWTDFVQQSPGTGPILPIRKTTNWADEEVDEFSEEYDNRAAKLNMVLPTAPKASRGYDDIIDQIPHHPPYMAYLTNLSYDLTEEEIEGLFSNLQIANMKIPTDDRAGELRLKGYGYVEFQDRDSLIEALMITDCTLRGRQIRIEVANADDRRKGGRMDSYRDRYDRPDRPEAPTGDWRSGPRAELPPQERSRNGGFSRDRERDGGDAIERGGSWRDNPDRPAFRDSDRDRYGSSDFDRGRDMRRDDREMRRDDREIRRDDRDMRRDDRDMRRDDRDRGFPREGRSFSRDGGDQWRDRRNDTDSSQASDKPEPPRVRQKIVLAPRTKPLETPQPTETDTLTKETVSAPLPSASIFGQAKPVDTAAREREIDALLQKQSEMTVREVGRDAPRRRDWGRRGDYRRSPEPSRRSPDRRSNSPQNSYEYKERGSLPEERKRSSPVRSSPVRRLPSPDQKEVSPEKKREDPSETTTLSEDKTQSKDAVHDREVSKVKEPEPPNFVACNKYAYLKAEEDSNSE